MRERSWGDVLAAGIAIVVVFLLFLRTSTSDPGVTPPPPPPATTAPATLAEALFSGMPAAELRVDGPRTMRAVFPTLPEVAVWLENVGAKPFSIVEHVGSRGLQRGHVWVEGGHGVLEVHNSSWWDPTPVTRLVQPGERLGMELGGHPTPCPVDLSQLARDAHAGGMTFTLVCGTDPEFSRRGPRAFDGGATTPQLELTWTPLEVRYAAGERAALEAAVAEMLTLPVVHLGTAPSTPERRELLQAGPRALPVLLEALQGTTDLHERAWLFALLYDASGLLDPRARAFQNRGALGSFDDGVQQDDGGPEPKAQRPLVTRWTGLSSLVREIRAR